MDQFFGTTITQEELQRRHNQRRHQRRATNSGLNTAVQQMDSMDQDEPMAGAEFLDEMMRNNQVLQRRQSLPQSMPQSYVGQMPLSEANRRLSMMDFGDTTSPFSDYQFTSPGNGMNNAFSGMNHGMTLPGTSGSFSPQTMAADDFPSITPEMMGSMIAFSNMNMGHLNNQMNSQMNSQMNGQVNGQMSRDGSTMGVFSTPYSQSMTPLSTDFAMDLTNDNVPLSAASSTAPNNIMMMDSRDSNLMDPQQGFGTNRGSMASTMSFQQDMSSNRQTDVPASPVAGSSAPFTPSLTANVPMAGANFNTPTTPSVAPSGSRSQSIAGSAQAPQALAKDQKPIYSKSGFDMLRALWLVATRKNPQVNLGAVDMSCAFVVCDVTQNDCPIVYVSDNFQNLTGYNRHEIMGKNCRFLQAPDGRVEAGTKREFVDNRAVYNLKQKVAEGREVQQSLINYRKGGRPFLNLLTMIPIPWDTPEVRYIIGFQIDLVECPEAISSVQGSGGTPRIDYKHNEIGQLVYTPPAETQQDPEAGQTLGVDDISTLLQQFNPKGTTSDWHRQSWDKMLLENADDVVHVLSLKGMFLYLSPSCKRILEYDAGDLMQTSLSSVCHPSDIVPVTRELKDTTNGHAVNIVFRIRRKYSGYTWFESHGSLFVEAGKGRKCIILIGRKRPVFALSRRSLESSGGIGDSELWTKLSTSGMLLFVSSNVRSLLDLQPDGLVGTSMQDLMRKESRPEFGRSIEKARRGRIVSCKHEVQNRRGQVLQAYTTLFPGDASEGQKPTFILAQTKLLKASSRAIAPASTTTAAKQGLMSAPASHSTTAGINMAQGSRQDADASGIVSSANGVPLGSQDLALASDDNIFDELKTTRCTSWQYELRQMEKINRILAEELHGLLSNKKKRKRRKGVGNVVRDCANCHTRNTPEWRRGPSGKRDLCNSCGLRWAKQVGRVSPRNSSRGGNGDSASKKSNSPIHSSPLHKERSTSAISQKSTDADSTQASRSLSGSAGPSTVGTTPAAAKVAHQPPLSQPMLEGGLEGEGHMPAIREE